MIRNATLRQLKVFEAVARNLNFTRAAEELHTTQPTVSIQLKQLTDLIGQPLIEQTGKRLSLTFAGEELLKVCRDIFDGLSRYEMLLADMRGVKAGRLKLSVISTAKYFVPRLLGLFCQRYPGIDVSLNVENREHLLQRMTENMDDIYVLGRPPEHMDVEVEPFLENPMVVLASRNHPLADVKNISPRRLADEQFLMREAGSGTRLSAEKFFAEHGLKLKVRMELGSNEAIKHAVAGGLGIAVLSAHTLALDRNEDELAVLDVEGFPIRRHWYLAYSKEKPLSILAQTFLEFMQKESQALSQKYLPGISGFPNQKTPAKKKR
jgi:LysR family transcriptional regulator, low CO2-responsive transcriptional regulator